MWYLVWQYSLPKKLQFKKVCPYSFPFEWCHVACLWIILLLKYNSGAGRGKWKLLCSLWFRSSFGRGSLGILVFHHCRKSHSNELCTKHRAFFSLMSVTRWWDVVCMCCIFSACVRFCGFMEIKWTDNCYPFAKRLVGIFCSSFSLIQFMDILRSLRCNAIVYQNS